MKPHTQRTVQAARQLIEQHRFGAFITGVIGLAIVLVLISMRLYYSSDAFRLDLSRPEYVELRSEITKGSETKDAFEAQGSVDEVVLDDFLRRYNTEADKVLKAKAFANDVLSDEQLGLSGSSEQPAAE